jgi:hypothetical protein
MGLRLSIGRISILLTFVAAMAGCGGSQNPTSPTPGSPAKSVTGELRDSFLFAHNAALIGGRTWRWVPPIPIFIGSQNADFEGLLLTQFLVWENTLGGVVSTPFFEPHPLATTVPRRGIFFSSAELAGPVIGTADPFGNFGAQAGRPELPRPDLHQTQVLRIPEVTAGGEVRRCLIRIDNRGFTRSQFAWTVRHEIGHCLGFAGHAPSGLMAPRCCSGAMTADVAGMMRKLYSLPPGTDVTR